MEHEETGMGKEKLKEHTSRLSGGMRQATHGQEGGRYRKVITYYIGHRKTHHSNRLEGAGILGYFSLF